jgi:zinc transport system substrate-binding protein
LRLVKIQAETIYEALATAHPASSAYYLENLKRFKSDLDALDRRIAASLKKATNRKFMVFHPAWGYFARDYGLEQIPIEIEGKEPAAKDLIRIVEEAKQEGIDIIFVQKQFSKTSAETVARAIGGKVVAMDPLAGDYLKNMEAIADRLAGVPR